MVKCFSCTKVGKTNTMSLLLGWLVGFRVWVLLLQYTVLTLFSERLTLSEVNTEINIIDVF